MSIIKVPHPTLRVEATPVTEVDKRILNIIAQLKADLQGNSKGVGLAAVQIDQPVRIFSTFLSKHDDDDHNKVFRAYINPEIIKVYGKPDLGDDEESTPLEGCLSIPDYYGPVPRYFKVKLAFQTWENDKLVSHEEEFEDFFARVVQHELDHLDGILFTDYSLKYDLPLYKENPKTGKLEEIKAVERKIFEMI